MGLSEGGRAGGKAWTHRASGRRADHVQQLDARGQRLRGGERHEEDATTESCSAHLLRCMTRHFCRRGEKRPRVREGGERKRGEVVYQEGPLWPAVEWGGPRSGAWRRRRGGGGGVRAGRLPLKTDLSDCSSKSQASQAALRSSSSRMSFLQSSSRWWWWRWRWAGGRATPTPARLRLTSARCTAHRSVQWALGGRLNKENGNVATPPPPSPPSPPHQCQVPPKVVQSL